MATVELSSKEDLMQQATTAYEPGPALIGLMGLKILNDIAGKHPISTEYLDGVIRGMSISNKVLVKAIKSYLDGRFQDGYIPFVIGEAIQQSENLKDVCIYNGYDDKEWEYV
jgi:hypothetical protein